jgi:hypothetical protein
MKTRASMIVYFDTSNNLNVTFFNGVTGTPESSKPLANIPLYKPFRLTIVVEDKIFTVYLNGQHAFQRAVPAGISKNNGDIEQNPLVNKNNQGRQGFYVPPRWSSSEAPSIFHQNLMLWQRPISAAEVREASPTLASEADFNMVAEQSEGTC